MESLSCLMAKLYEWLLLGGDVFSALVIGPLRVLARVSRLNEKGIAELVNLALVGDAVARVSLPAFFGCERIV